jgi:hypothetical protein
MDGVVVPIQPRIVGWRRGKVNGKEAKIAFVYPSESTARLRELSARFDLLPSLPGAARDH